MDVSALINKKAIICLMGPTASGKTGLAIELVQQIPCEIISVDSAMIYQGMDIGTATPTAAELAKAPHRLINICDPAEAYSVGQFCEDAHREIAEIHANQRIPLLVGGTMMYFNMLQKGFADMPPTDMLVREQVANFVDQYGYVELHKALQKHDPETASRLHPNDKQRLSRAYEIYLATGKSLTDWQSQQTLKPIEYPIYNLILAPVSRAELHRRIALRFDLMLEQGFMQEVATLYARMDLSPNFPAIRTVGYRQAWEHLSGTYDMETMRERAIIATRQLAKRQLTWLRRWENASWLDSLSDNLLHETLSVLSES